MGIFPQITNWSAAADEFSLIFDSNPLTEFVELPDHCLNLKYSNIFSGILRGALEMVSEMWLQRRRQKQFSNLLNSQVHLEVSSWFIQDQLKGDNVTELRVKFIKKLEDAVPAGED